MNLRVDLIPAHRGASAKMVVDGVEIGISRDCIYDAARWFLRSGTAKPDDQITTYRNGVACLTGTIGKLAELTVEDRASGIRVRKYEPYGGRAPRASNISENEGVED